MLADKMVAKNRCTWWRTRRRGGALPAELILLFVCLTCLAGSLIVYRKVVNIGSFLGSQSVEGEQFTDGEARDLISGWQVFDDLPRESTNSSSLFKQEEIGYNSSEQSEADEAKIRNESFPRAQALIRSNRGSDLIAARTGNRSARSAVEDVKDIERNGRAHKRTIRAERKPILNEFSFPANLVQGMRFVLMCQVLDGEPPIQIKWFKDNQEFQANGLNSGLSLESVSKLELFENHQTHQSVELLANDELGSSLLFRRVQPEHGGNYTCLANNRFGSASYSSFMSVKVAPKWRVEPQDQESIMGEQVIIDCQAQGWKFTSQPMGVVNQQQQQQLRHQMIASEDTIASTTTTTTTTTSASATTTTTLSANGEQLGASFKLINSNHHVQTLENGSLSIRQTNKEHEGLYLCEADNGVEPSLVKVLRLTVHTQAQLADDIQLLEWAPTSMADFGAQPASLSPIATSFATFQQSAGAKPIMSTGSGSMASGSASITSSNIKSARLPANANNSARLLCQPFGDPPLTLEWLKDGQLIYTHTSAMLITAADRFGQSSAARSLLSEETSAGLTQLTQPTALARYQVSARRSNQRPINGLESELIVSNLRRSDAGTYTCLARNTFGQSERKLRLILQEQPEPPELVDVAHISSRSISLRWSVPFDGNSPILKYIIEYKRQLSPDRLHADQTEHWIQAGQSGHLAAAYGGQSEKIVVPSASSVVKSASSSSSSSTLSPVEGGLIKQQHHEQVAPGGFSSQSGPIGAQQLQVQHTVHELEPLTRYAMRVVAVNALGRSRPSVALSLRTAEEGKFNGSRCCLAQLGANFAQTISASNWRSKSTHSNQSERKLRLILQEQPEPPELVDVAHISSRSISLRWSVPFDGNSPILKYIIEYKRQLSPDRLHADQTEHWIQAGQSGHLAAAYGGQSEKIVVPSASSVVKSASSSSSSSTLSPVEGGLIKQQHHEQVAPGGFSSQSGPIGAQQLQVQHTVHELEPLTRYAMRVVAVNALGRSRPSVALSLRTAEEVPSIVPTLVEAVVLSSKSIKLRWTISYSAEREIVDGFFVGYRSFETNSLLLDAPSSSSSSSSSASSSAGQLKLGPNNGRNSEQATFTYKTIRLTNQPQVAAPSANTDDSENNLRAQQQSNAADQTSAAFLSPISTITKSVASQTGQMSFGLIPGVGQEQPQQQAIIVSSFEYVIAGLERNTEYTILIQCFNKKGAGPTSDPILFKTFMNDPPGKLALNADEVTESSVKVSWKLQQQMLMMMSASEHPATANKWLSEPPIDGYVLTFAKVLSAKSQLAARPKQLSRQSEQGASLESGQASLRSPASPDPQPSFEQWQSIQMAPQQRNHQLRNLECGTSYAMKIWAFNKIGKGEPSELITVSTRGKAPVAPDRRSFISINSTQIRLHLSAWYDGGCEIDKFVVQYRVRGQLEWILVSNNIMKEQTSVLIRDLLPATGYELLVAATNQVGTSESKYRFATLDLDGKQVFAGHSSFLGGSTNQEELGEGGDDYSSETDGQRGQFWLNGSGPAESLRGYRSWIVFVKHLLNSPIALIMSLCLFVGLLTMLIFYRFNGLSAGSTATISSNKSNGSSSQGRRLSNEANTTIIDGELIGGLATDSLSGSPMRVSLAANTGNQHPRLHSTFPPSECHYQSFCGPIRQSNNANDCSGLTTTSSELTYGFHHHQPPQQQQQQQSSQVSNYAAIASAGCDLSTPPAGQPTYASVHRSATMDPASIMSQQQHLDSSPESRSDSQQQCLMQMLLMSSQQQQQQSSNPGEHNFVPDGFNASNTNNHHPYLASQALATLARSGNKLGNNLKQHLASIGYMPNSYQQALGSNLTLGRQQPHQQHINANYTKQLNGHQPSCFSAEPPNHLHS